MRRVAAVLLAGVWLGTSGAMPAQASDAPPPLKVSQNQLLDANGNQVHLTGVNRSGTEYACVQGWGIFDGPADDASVAAIASWGANAVRIGLNEDCWLGINGVKPQYGGDSYRQAIEAYVDRLHRHGLYAVIALMWAAPGANPAMWQEAMADADHSIAFWSSVAATFKDDGAALFDLYGEPSWVDWQCWADGCTYADKFGSWQTAGVGKLLQAVRQTGARNVVLISGIDYANDLSSWLAYAPADPINQVAAAFHLYGDNTCHDSGCWDSGVREVARRVPVVTAELGERADGKSCGHTFVDSYVSYARSNGISYLAWAWDAWNSCSTLILDYAGTPTVFGADYRQLLAGGPAYTSLPYTATRPSKPFFGIPEPQHERTWLAVAGLLLLLAAAAFGWSLRRKPRPR